MNSTPAVYVESLERGYRVATPLSKEHDKETQWMVGCLYIYTVYIYIYPFCCFSTYSTQQLSMFCCGFWPRSCSLQVFAMVLAANLWPQSPSKESGRGRLFLGGINDLACKASQARSDCLEVFLGRQPSADKLSPPLASPRAARASAASFFAASKSFKKFGRG